MYIHYNYNYMYVPYLYVTSPQFSIAPAEKSLMCTDSILTNIIAVYIHVYIYIIIIYMYVYEVQ